MKIWQSKQIFIVVACLCSGKMLFSQNSHDINYGTILEEIRISGARFTVTEIITRELASQVGQPYIRKNADRDYARLDSNTTDTVKVAAAIGGGKHVVIRDFVMVYQALRK